MSGQSYPWSFFHLNSHSSESVANLSRNIYMINIIRRIHETQNTFYLLGYPSCSIYAFLIPFTLFEAFPNDRWLLFLLWYIISLMARSGLCKIIPRAHGSMPYWSPRIIYIWELIFLFSFFLISAKVVT